MPAGGMMALADLADEWGDGTPVEAFRPCARYYDGMDVVLYIKEDVSYRADRVDAWLTLLWHPHEDRAVGVKLKGVRFLFGRMQSQARSLGRDLRDKDFIPLLAALETAITASWGALITKQAERDRIEEKYRTAKAVVEGVNVAANEVPLAA